MKRIRNILACSLLVIFVSYLGATTLFMHSHTIHGITFVHSHPFTHHKDTAEQAVTIAVVSHYLLSNIPEYVFKCLAPAVSVYILKVLHKVQLIQTEPILWSLLRAPPVQ